MRLLGAGLAALCCGFAQQPDLVVVEKISNSVGFYTADGQRVAGVAVGEHPHEMVFSPDGRRLYVSDNGILWMTYAGQGGNTISIIDVRQRKKAGVIDLGNYRRPHGMDLDPRTGRMVVTIENPDGLLLVDPAERKVLRKYNVKGTDPHMVIFRPKAEWAYTGVQSLDKVHIIDVGAKQIARVFDTPKDSGPDPVLPLP